jgi:hypothetical protein
MAKENTMIQMYGTTVGASTAVIDVPDDGMLLRANLIVVGILNADAERVTASLEFGSTSAISTNDARSVLAYAEARLGVVTTGGGLTQRMERFDYADGIQVFGGERLYIHTAESGGVLQYAKALLLFNFAKFIARRR